MKSLVCHQAQHLELNPFLYGQPMKLTKDWGDMFISSSTSYFPCKCIYLTYIVIHKWCEHTCGGQHLYIENNSLSDKFIIRFDILKKMDVMIQSGTILPSVTVFRLYN